MHFNHELKFAVSSQPPSVRKMLVLQKRRKPMGRSKTEHQPLFQSSLDHLISNNDPLWYLIPEMGIEGLIATIKSKKELQKALKNDATRKRKLYRNYI